MIRTVVYGIVYPSFLPLISTPALAVFVGELELVSLGLDLGFVFIACFYRAAD